MARKKPLARTFYWSCNEPCWSQSESSARHYKKLPPLAGPFMNPSARYLPHVFLGVNYAAWHRTAKPSLPPLSSKTHRSCGVSRSCLVPHFLLARRRTATRQRHPPCCGLQVAEPSANDAQYLLRYFVKGNHRQTALLTTLCPYGPQLRVHHVS